EVLVAGISKAIVIGNLGRDPEVRYTPNGTMNVQFTVAASRRYRDQSGQQQEATNWFRVTAWGKLAETLVSLTESGALVKGKQVFVEGRLDAREYTDQNGQTRTSLDVNATEIQLLGSRGDFEGGGGGFGDESSFSRSAPQSGGSRSGRQPRQQQDNDDIGGDSIDDVPF
ncbi:MAG TPA: single-stranded DNA-binding protein, partial [Thermomicrobiales bacterium]|nr:single-stranded DNA-binding protein [Thermomicrobiales bacterium]